MFALNCTKNLCEILGNGYKRGPDINLIVNPLKKYSNAVQSCPYKVSLLDIYTDGIPI